MRGIGLRREPSTGEIMTTPLGTSWRAVFRLVLAGLLVGTAARLWAQEIGDATKSAPAPEGVSAAAAGVTTNEAPAVVEAAAAAPEKPVAPEADPDDVRVHPKRFKDYNLPGLNVKVFLKSLEPWDVSQLIEYLAFKGGLNNFVMSKGISGLTTKLKFDDVTVGDALEVVLSVNNLAYEFKGGIVTIMTDEEYKALNGRSFIDNKQVRIIELKYADATRVANMLAPVKSQIGTVVSDPITGTLILIDTPDKITEMRAVIAKADLTTVSRQLPTETKSFVLQYAKVEDIQGEVSALLTKEAGSLRVDKRTKTMIVTDLPHNMDKINDLVLLFDRRPKQVFIEAKIVEVKLDDSFSLGINWTHLFDGLDPRFALRAVSQPPMPDPLAGTLKYSTIVAGGDLQVVLDALKAVGDTKILSNPQIAVLDGEEATIEVVSEQPYKEIKLEAGTTNVTGVTYQFKKWGVMLSVTPRINDEKMVSVKIKPEISGIDTWYDGSAQQGTPVIKKATAATTVMVQDTVTIIIGGLIQNKKTSSMTGLPVLSGIPLLGRLFRSDSESSFSTETVVFLTPRIVSGEEPYLRLKDMKKRAKPLRPVGEENGKQFKAIR